MLTFPSIPGWDGIHPAMVQFAIVSLWVAPILLLVSLFLRRTWHSWASAALLVMTLGSVAAWLAVASGHAAGQLVDKTPVLQQAIARHEALGVMTRNVFTTLTLVLAVVMLLPVMIRKTVPAAARTSVYALFLVAYLGSTLAIANTASQGGRLVHELGIRAMVTSATVPEEAVAAERTARAGQAVPAATDRTPSRSASDQTP